MSKHLHVILKRIVLKSKSWDIYEIPYFGVVVWTQMYSTVCDRNTSRHQSGREKMGENKKILKHVMFDSQEYR